jgi:hypothetical protein
MLPVQHGRFLVFRSEPEYAIWNSKSDIVCFCCPENNEFATRAGPSEIAGFRRLVFAPMTKQENTNARLTLRAQPVDATPSNQLIRQCF